MLPKHIRLALKIIVPEIVNSESDYVVVGRTALALQNINTVISDVDIATSKEGVFYLARRLKKYLITKPIYNENDIISGYFSQYKIGDVVVEVMGDARNKIDGRVINYNPIKYKQIIVFDKHNLTIMQLEDQLITNVLLNRQKRTKKLFNILKERGLNTDYLIELYATTPELEDVIKYILKNVKKRKA